MKTQATHRPHLCHRARPLPCLALLGVLGILAAAAPAATVTWTDAAAGDSNWGTAGNWSPSGPGTGDTPLFTNNLASYPGTSVLDGGDWTVGGLQVRNPDGWANGTIFAHHLNLNSNRLVVNGDAEIGRYTTTVSGGLPSTMGTVTLNVSNGILQIGTSSNARNLTIGRGRNYTIGGELIMGAGSTLEGHFDTVIVAGQPDGGSESNRTITGLLDVQNAGITDGSTAGAFKANNLYVASNSAHHVNGLTGEIRFGSSLASLEVANKLVIGSGVRAYAYVGSYGGNGTAMPANVDITVGSLASPGSIEIARGGNGGNGTSYHAGHLVAGNGGAFTGYLNSLTVASRQNWTATGNRSSLGVLDLSNMETITLAVSGEAVIGQSGDKAGDLATARVYLPTGTAAFNNLSVGPMYGSGLLDLYGTDATVNGTLAISANGDIIVRVGADFGSLTVASPSAVEILPGGLIDVRFADEPSFATGKAHIGFAIGGGTAQDVQDLLIAGSLTYSTTGLSAWSLSYFGIWEDDGQAFLGVLIPEPASGLLLVLAAGGLLARRRR